MKTPTKFYVLICILISACAPSTKITGSWKNQNMASAGYSSFYIAVLTSDEITRAYIEGDIESNLQPYGVKTTRSILEFPPTLKKDSIDKNTILKKVRSNGTDAILTITILKKETQSRYIPGDYVYDPIPLYGYYGTFGGYYSYWQPILYSPGYYTVDQIYFLETNLYDVKTEQLVWSTQSKTYNANTIQSFSKEYAKLIINKLKEDGLLKMDKPLTIK